MELSNDDHRFQDEAIVEIWDIEGIPTESLTLKAEGLAKDENPLVFFVIPGNPGVVQYYAAFMYYLWLACDKKIELVAVQHPGHSTSINLWKILNLQEQIQHKINVMDYLMDKYSPLSKFIIAGHSIGAYMALKVLRARPNYPILKVINLFPTLHSIAETPKGREVSILTLPVIRHTAVLFILLLRLILILTPNAIKPIVRAATKQKSRDLDITCDKLIHPGPVLHATTLGAWEMQQVKELDEEIIRDHLDKMIFYYSKDDRWAPLSHFEDMKERFPSANIHLCDKDLPHSFVIGYSDVMAYKVRDWIKQHY
ncbi:hypothetical protein HDU97_005274 [Phlyctochytrium planicorne]|nr:hypothetical protein HDU97_005274 [Phlyctochytrium planicorne]